MEIRALMLSNQLQMDPKEVPEKDWLASIRELNGFILKRRDPNADLTRSGER